MPVVTESAIAACRAAVRVAVVLAVARAVLVERAHVRAVAADLQAWVVLAVAAAEAAAWVEAVAAAALVAVAEVAVAVVEVVAAVVAEGGKWNHETEQDKNLFCCKPG